MIFEITDRTTGTVHEFRAPDPSTITVREWVHLTVPPMEAAKDFREELDRVVLMCHRYAGIPIGLLRGMPMPELRRLMEALDTVAQAAKDARVNEEPLPEVLEWKGKTYTIPKEPGTALTLGQYLSVVDNLGKYEYQDESLAVVLACALIPDGEEFSTGTLDARIADFMELPAILAIRMAAFFFAGSTDLSDTWLRYISQRVKSSVQAAQQALTGSGTSTGTT